MAICNKVLQAEGRPYPRTCSKCSLGPCKEPKTLTLSDGSAPLKQVSGLVQKLSYRDMHTFAEKIAENLNGIDAADFAEALLKTSDEILKAA